MNEKSQKDSKSPKKKQPFFSFIKRILRIFYKKPKIVYLGEKIRQPSIIISNHVSLKGPMIHELFLPVPTVKWGAGEMLGNYKMRFKYLRDVFYMQKNGYGKVRSTILATFSAFFSKFFYKGMRVVPTWHDVRLFKTVSNSVKTLKGGTSILIFPENSSDGYHDILTEFHQGFITLAESYYKKTKEMVPVYPVYYHKGESTLIVGSPRYVHEYAERGLTRSQIASEFCKIVNDLNTNFSTTDIAA